MSKLTVTFTGDTHEEIAEAMKDYQGNFKASKKTSAKKAEVNETLEQPAPEAQPTAPVQQAPIAQPVTQPQMHYAPPQQQYAQPPVQQGNWYPGGAPTQPYENQYQQQPVTQQPAQPMQAAPTQTPALTQDMLSRAAAQVLDAGRGMDLQNILAQFGIQALTQLPTEQYQNFAAALRSVGAMI